MGGLDSTLVLRAARAIADADALLIGAGAGMGVDSGLPDFRGVEGFWKAYPPFARLGLRFAEVANPAHFRTEPALAWGFYGHRGNLYRATMPHDGFRILREWGGRKSHGGYVLTSNVDNHFSRAGFAEDRIVEVHGSIEYRQCLGHCGAGIFPADAGNVSIEEATFRAPEPWPSCPACGALARPNILMFNDSGWDSARTDRQTAEFMTWTRSLPKQQIQLVVVEIGAGTAIPTIRHLCESITERYQGTLIRINPREFQVPRGQVGLAAGAVEALRAIDAAMPR